MEYNKNFVDIIKSNLREVNHPIIGDYFYEWKIEDWNSISNKKSIRSPEFIVHGHKWKLELYPNGCDDFYKGNVSLYLYRDNSEDDCSVHVTVNRVFFIRNYYDTNCYHAATLPIEYLSKSVFSSGHPNLISRSQLNNPYGYSNRPLIENNKCVFGVYFQIYKNEKGHFKREITCYVDDEDRVVEHEHFYEWEVGNWNKSKHYPQPENSPSFVVGGLRWVLMLYKDGDGYENKKYVSLYLKCLNPEINPEGTWVNAILYLRNCDSENECFCFDVLEPRNFNRNNVDWGFSKLIKKKELFIKGKYSNCCVVENDKCIVGVYFHIYGKGKVKKDNLGGIQSSTNAPTQQYTYQPYQNLPPYSVQGQQYPPSSSPAQQHPPNQEPPPYCPMNVPPQQQYPPYQYPPYQYPPNPMPQQYPPYQYPPYQYPPSPYNNPPFQAPFQNPPPYYYPPPNQNYPTRGVDSKEEKK